eukprot:5994299-Pyramimonas_sp.AAC.1
MIGDMRDCNFEVTRGFETEFDRTPLRLVATAGLARSPGINNSKHHPIASAIIKKRSQKPDHPGTSMSMKAGESGMLLPFCNFIVHKYGGRDKFGPHLICAILSLCGFLEAMRTLPSVIDEAMQLRLMCMIAVHTRACKLAGISITPKHHLAWHIAHRAEVRGKVGGVRLSRDMPNRSDTGCGGGAATARRRSWRE